MHVLFDESNSLSKNDAHEEDFELGLAKKDLVFIHEKGKSHSEGSGPQPGSKEEGHNDKQTGGTVAEPCLQQNKNSNSGTGPGTDPAPSSSESQTIEDSVAMNPPIPRAWKPHRSHPLDQILTDLNSGGANKIQA